MDPTTPADNSGSTAPPESTGNSLKDGVEAVFRYRRVVLLCLVAGALVGLAYAMSRPAQFETRASFMITYENSPRIERDDRMRWSLSFLNTFYEGYDPKRYVADLFISSDFLHYALRRTFPGEHPKESLDRAARLVRKRLNLETNLEESYPVLSVSYRSPYPREPVVVLSGLLESLPPYTAREFRRNLKLTFSLSKQLLEKGDLGNRQKKQLARRASDIRFALRVNQFTDERFSIVLLNDPRLRRKARSTILGVLSGTAGGLLLGVLLAVTFTAMDPFLRTPEDVRLNLDLPLLGSIPGAASAEGSPDLTVHPHSPVAESFHRLDAMLTSRTEGGREELLVTSPSNGEGKTTVSCNLARSFARRGNRTLLADFDLREGDLHRKMGLPRSPGVTSLLTDRCSLREALNRREDGPDVLSRGPDLGNPSDLLTGDRVERVLDEARRQYDWVILDSPPVLGRADTRIVSRLVDGVLLVFRARQTHLQAARQALDAIRAIDAPLLGCVFNDSAGPDSVAPPGSGNPSDRPTSGSVAASS